jgi:DNA-directed RNA polymerase specialized sigma24 family protein
MKSLSAIKSYSSDIDDYSYCENNVLNEMWQNKEMSFEKLLEITNRVLFGYARVLSKQDYDRSWELMGIMNDKILKNKETFMSHPKPLLYAKLIMKRSSIDLHRAENRFIEMQKKQSLYSIKETPEDVIDELEKTMECIKKLDEVDQTILTMKGQGNSDKEIHEAVNVISEKEITLGNLRVKTSRARIKLAKLTGRNYE